MEGGFDAVRHRAVADRAQLPLASTTYYFESLEDLVVEAVTHVSHHDEDAIRDRATHLARRRRGCEASAEALADVFVGSDEDRDLLVTRCETVVLAQRFPRLRPLLANRGKLIGELHHEVLGKSHRSPTPGGVAHLMAVEEGAVVRALSDCVDDVHALTYEALCHVVETLAPSDR
ncbi:TetR family transcriptional regulator [Williamsia deligens]